MRDAIVWRTIKGYAVGVWVWSIFFVGLKAGLIYMVWVSGRERQIIRIVSTIVIVLLP